MHGVHGMPQVPMARHASAPPAPAPSPANVDSVFAEIPAQEPDPSAYHDHDEQLPSDYMEAGMEASFAAGGPSESGGSPPHPEKEIRVQGGSFSFHTQPEQQRQSDLQELVLHGHPAGGGGGRLEQPTALPAAYDRARCECSPSIVCVTVCKNLGHMGWALSLGCELLPLHAQITPKHCVLPA